MKQNAPLKRNDDIELVIDALGSDGQGIGRVNGFAVFVPFALPGERVRAHVIKPASSYAVAKLTEVLQASPDRISPKCPAFGKCGGCALMHMKYPAQLEAKRQMVQSALSRIGGVDIDCPSVIGMDEPWRYRNKASFPLASVNGEARFGFFAPRSHRLVPLEDCIIQREELVRIARAVCQWADERGISMRDEQTGRGCLRHIVARETMGGEAMAAIVGRGTPKHLNELLETMTDAVPQLSSVVYNRNDENTNVIFSRDFQTLLGSGYVTETLCGLSFDISAASFMQVNPKQTEALYGLVDSFVPKGTIRNAADVYCGAGTITLLLARHCEKITGIEYVSEAIEDAKRNAGKNNITNASFVCGDAAEALPSLVASPGGLDLIVVDPPRKGCDKPVIDAIAASKADTLIYVSCDPATLARDIKLLAGAYRVEKVQSVDMFPHTPHVESVVLMSRKEIDTEAIGTNSIFGI